LIEYTVTGGVARLTLNRPNKRNALNPELIGGIEAFLGRAAADPAVRVVLLRGAGPDFCAGVDLAGLLENPDPDVMDHLEDAQRIAGLYSALRRHPRPIVAAVHGRALGGGCGLATACDIALASESAQFRYSEIDLGFVAAIVLSLLRRSVGEKQAFELVAMGESWTASQAHRIGMLNHVYPDDTYEANVEEYVDRLARKSATALALTKRLLHHTDGMNLETAMESGIFVNALARSTSDAQRGIEQFVRKNR
jgi:methylglutaconyl-CoA hydratase